MARPSLLKFLAGLALAPTAFISLWVSSKAVARLAAGSLDAAPFVAGAALCLLTRLFVDFRRSCVGRAARSVYVFGHELTHALSAWAMGGRVFGFKAGEGGGSVDLSKSNAFIALAPYCIPLYTIFVIVGYRVWIFFDPAPRCKDAYLLLMGLTLSYHLIFTLESLWVVRQPDLDAAGGAFFSLPVIALANGLLMLCLFKVLFPGVVSLWKSLLEMAQLTQAFWLWAGESLMRLGWRLRKA